MKAKVILTLLLILFSIGSAFSISSMVVFRERVEKGDTTQLLKLVLKEKPEYPVQFVKTPKEIRWVMQLYKDGGDGIISPLDSLSNPTGDDILINHPSHLNASQGIYFAVNYMWVSNGISFYPKGESKDAWQGDKIYLRIFNNTSIDKADKYIVSHTLYQVPVANAAVEYAPDYGWDTRGWISFRKNKK